MWLPRLQDLSFTTTPRESFDTGNCADDDERERLLRLLEHVLRNVQQLAEKDALSP